VPAFTCRCASSRMMYHCWAIDSRLFHVQ
jgi:hypothetical protein